MIGFFVKTWHFSLQFLLFIKIHSGHNIKKKNSWRYFFLKIISLLRYIVVHSLSHVWLFVIPWTAACQAPLLFTVSWSLFKFMSIELVMPSNHLVLCRLLLLTSIFPSIRVFSNELALHIRWPNYWSFSFSISPSNEYSRLISSRIDWFDLLAVQGTLKSVILVTYCQCIFPFSFLVSVT